VLAAAGLAVLARRFRGLRGEIDLVATDGDLVVFVEVKARAGDGYGAPAEAVTARKRARMARVALEFLARAGWTERPCRFDVVEVWVGREGDPCIRHLPDAFRLWPTG
jgi:putative endonuclease